DVALVLKSETGQVLDREQITFNAVQTRNISMSPIEVCDAKDSLGSWQCADWRLLPDILDFFRLSAPAPEVNPGFFIGGRSTVRLDTADYPSDGDQWWQDAVNEIQSLRKEAEAPLGDVFYGLVRAPCPPGA